MHFNLDSSVFFFHLLDLFLNLLAMFLGCVWGGRTKRTGEGENTRGCEQTQTANCPQKAEDGRRTEEYVPVLDSGITSFSVSLLPTYKSHLKTNTSVQLRCSLFYTNTHLSPALGNSMSLVHIMLCSRTIVKNA